MTSNSPELPDQPNYRLDPWVEEYDETMMLCPTCDGLGCDNWDDEELCWRCYGEGMIPRS